MGAVGGVFSSDAARRVVIKNLPWVFSRESHFYPLARLAIAFSVGAVPSAASARPNQCRVAIGVNAALRLALMPPFMGRELLVATWHAASRLTLMPRRDYLGHKKSPRGCFPRRMLPVYQRLLLLGCSLCRLAGMTTPEVGVEY